LDAGVFPGDAEPRFVERPNCSRDVEDCDLTPIVCGTSLNEDGCADDEGGDTEAEGFLTDEDDDEEEDGDVGGKRESGSRSSFEGGEGEEGRDIERAI
jgi:hypothetical protein